MMNQRVEIPAWADQWMQGDRFGELLGTVQRKGETIARVKLDKTGRVVRFGIDELRVV